jgi:hypothetical protein
MGTLIARDTEEETTMRTTFLVFVTCVSLGGLAGAQTETPAPAADDEEYAAESTFEVGGSVALNWTSETFDMVIGPSVGWFVADQWELSILTRYAYSSVEQEDGTRESTDRGSILFEPSFHHPLRADGLYLFVGLGVGIGYDDDKFDFETVPRVGLNIGVGRAGVFTPAIRVPILVGRDHGPGDDSGVDVGFGFEASFTTTF